LTRTGEKIVSIVIPGIMAIAGIIALVSWLQHDPTASFVMHIPGMDGKPAMSAAEEQVVIGEFFERFTNIPHTAYGNWPRFRGANYDNISTESTALAAEWQDDGPDILWSVDLGEGHAAPAVLGGRVYLLDYDEKLKADMLRCFALSDGMELWRRWYSVKIKRNHGMSRTIPAVTEQYVVTVGPKCHVMCMDARTGDLLWGIDMVKDYGTKVPGWYTGQCPLIDDGIAVLAPAGSNVLMMGVACATGEIVWETPNEHGWHMSHSSVMPVTVHDARMYLYSASGGILGVSAEEHDRGRILWETNAWNHTVIAPSPIALDGDRIFITAGYGAGSMMLKIDRHGDDFTVSILDTLTPKDGLASEQQTPVLYNGYLYGILPKDAGPLKNQLVCVHADDVRTVVWSSGKTNRFGLGPYKVADGKLYVLDDDGELTVLAVTHEGYRQLERVKMLDGRDAWGPLAITEGRILLRDSKRMICIDARKL
jgi:outer membrane protein assembly factor BamB